MSGYSLFPGISRLAGADVEFKDKEYLKRVYEILGTDKVLIRSYRNNDGDRVSMQVVYSDQKRQVSILRKIVTSAAGTMKCAQGKS
jgi:hypothetical protein